MINLTDKELDDWIELNIFKGCLHKNIICHHEEDGRGYVDAWNSCIDYGEILERFSDYISIDYSSSISCAFSVIDYISKKLSNNNVLWNIKQFRDEHGNLIWSVRFQESSEGSVNKRLSRAICEEIYKYYKGS